MGFRAEESWHKDVSAHNEVICVCRPASRGSAHRTRQSKPTIESKEAPESLGPAQHVQLHSVVRLQGSLLRICLRGCCCLGCCQGPGSRRSCLS